jgi:hypothetical protein
LRTSGEISLPGRAAFGGLFAKDGQPLDGSVLSSEWIRSEPAALPSRIALSFSRSIFVMSDPPSEAVARRQRNGMFDALPVRCARSLGLSRKEVFVRIPTKSAGNPGLKSATHSD